MKWEYKLVTATHDMWTELVKARMENRKPEIDSVQDVLNTWGEEGWELVNIQTIEIDDEDSIYAYFKRPK